MNAACTFLIKKAYLFTICGAITAGSSLVFPTTAQADGNAVSIASKLQDTRGIPQPARGASKTTVEKKFGQPAKWSDPVGTPPITRWDYERFSVYFEYDHVIDSVIARPQQK